MFKKENRLVPGVKFTNSYSSALPQFILKTKTNGLAVNRFGIVVSKKIDKRAVGRNEIKRFFRTALINLYEKMNLGHDILLVIRQGILVRPKEENFLAIKGALDKAGILKIKN